MTTLLVSIIIPTYNRSDVLERTLLAFLNQQCASAGLEVIVVDDGSTDDTPSILARISASDRRVRVIRQANRGPAAARNAGIRESRGILVLFGGDDVVPASHLVETHVHAHARHADAPVAVLGYITWSRELEITPFMQWLESDGMQFGFSSIRDREDVPSEMFYSSNISVRRDFLLSGELFDEGFTAACWEDVDLGLRLRKRGLRIIYEQDAIGHHVHRTDFDRFARRTKTAGYFRAMLVKKHGLAEEKKVFVREVTKWICGTLMRVFGRGRLRRLGYRWSLSWHEYVGMKKFTQKKDHRF